MACEPDGRHGASVGRLMTPVRLRRTLRPTIGGMGSNALNQARDKMADAGVDPVAIEVFAHYYRLVENGETGMIPESTIEPLDMEALADVDVPDDVAAEAIADHRGDQAQRRPRHLDGHGPRQVAAVRAPRPVLPRHHRPAGAVPPREVRRPAAADLHEQLPHLRATPWRRWPATTTSPSTACRWSSCRTRSPSCWPTTSPRRRGRRTPTSSGARPATATSTPRCAAPACSTG